MANAAARGTLDKQESHRIRCVHHDASSFPRSTQPTVSSGVGRCEDRQTVMGWQEGPGPAEHPIRRKNAPLMENASRFFPTAMPLYSGEIERRPGSIAWNRIFATPNEEIGGSRVICAPVAAASCRNAAAGSWPVVRPAEPRRGGSGRKGRLRQDAAATAANMLRIAFSNIGEVGAVVLNDGGESFLPACRDGEE